LCFCAKGIIASEANISLGAKTRKLGDILIAAKEKNKRDFIRQLLEKIKIVPDRDKEIRGMEGVLITGLSNFKIMDKFDLCILHPEKHKNFKIGISNFKVEQSRKGEGRLLVLQHLANGPKTRQELGKLLNRSPDTIKTEALLILEKQGLVERGEINNKHRVWKITQKGLDILNSNNPLEELRNRK
jgi:DNA-binding HxlR family transcriptional regulator